MPTLYSTEGYKFKKPSIIELVLYNMAALLGGVAAGYDVRVSNVSPLHPTLQPHREAEPEPASTIYEGYGFAHNTYHGPARHLRAPLHAVTGSPISSLQTEEQKPIRFTDSPTHYAHASSSSGYGHSAQPLSGTSGLGTYASTPTPSPRRASAASDHLADLYHNYRENFPPPAAAYDRTAEYVGRHPYCADDCPDCREPAPDYRPAPYLAHRRTPSDSSASASHADEYAAPRYPPREYRGAKAEYPRRPPDYSLPRDFYRPEPGDAERPANLGLELAPARLRSSLKKYNKRASASGGSSGAGTPPNPTPPDSLASETDSSYVSARDASAGSHSHSRVRFSPDTLDAALALAPALGPALAPACPDERHS